MARRIAGLGVAFVLLLGLAFALRQKETTERSPELNAVLSAVADAGVSVIGDSVSLGGSRSVQLGVASFETGKAGHLHVTARSGGEPPLDFCILGSSNDVAEVATQFVKSGLPVALAAAGANGSGALPFSGESPWGVKGVRGYSSQLAIRGELDVEWIKAFAKAPPMVADGRTHLLKAVIGCVPECTRTLELDGKIIEENQPFTELSSRGIGMAVAFAVFRDADRRADTDAAKRAHSRISLTIPLSTLPLGIATNDCPSLPAHFIEHHYDDEACLGGRLEDCVKECKSGLGHSCYSLALTVQRDTTFSPKLEYEFFSRACDLGVASGCTNFITGPGGKPPAACDEAAYKRLCLEPGDPWSCAMWSYRLAAHEPQDALRIQEAVERACRASESDPACQFARHVPIR